MTNTTLSAKAEYTGDGVTTVFPTTFKFLDNNHVSVILRDSSDVEIPWIEGTQYTLTGVNLANGGNVIVKTTPTDYTPAVGEMLFVILNVPLTQEKSFPFGGPFPSRQVEEGFDLSSMGLLQLQEVFRRAIKAPETDSNLGDGLNLPIDTVRANKFMAFDSLGKPSVAVGTSGNLSPVSAFVDTLLSAADAASFRTLIASMLDVITTRGDIAVGDAIGDTVRLPAGTNGQQLQMSGSDPAWVTPSSSQEFTTGDCKITIKTTPDTGWVMADDGTIGNASSGGSNRANADTEDLFELIWNNISNTYAPLFDSGGSPATRGASAQADFDANSRIQLSTIVGRALGVQGSGVGLTARTLGEALGEEAHVLITGEMSSHSHKTVVNESHITTLSGSETLAITGNAGTTDQQYTLAGDTSSSTPTLGPTSNTGSSNPHNNMQPTSFLNLMIKL